MAAWQGLYRAMSLWSGRRARTSTASAASPAPNAYRPIGCCRSRIRQSILPHSVKITPETTRRWPRLRVARSKPSGPHGDGAHLGRERFELVGEERELRARGRRDPDAQARGLERRLLQEMKQGAQEHRAALG